MLQQKEEPLSYYGIPNGYGAAKIEHKAEQIVKCPMQRYLGRLPEVRFSKQNSYHQNRRVCQEEHHHYEVAMIGRFFFFQFRSPNFAPRI